MNEECTGFGNTGFYENCDSNFKVMRGLFIVPTYDATGARNKIAAGTLVDAAYLSARLSDTDKLKRWYPLMPIEAATSDRQDPVTFANPSGSIEFVKQGVKNFNAEIRRRGAEFKGQIDACECNALSFFAVDIDGKLRGMITTLDAVSDFYPIAIQPGSFNSKLVDATEENPEHLMFNFQYELSVKDSLLRVYPTNLSTANYLLAKGLYDVFMDVSSVTTTGFVASLRTIYTDGDKFRPTGLLVGDFALYNESDELAIVITSVTENDPGVYTFVMPANPTTEIKKLTPTKAGFDFAKVVANTFTDGL